MIRLLLLLAALFFLAGCGHDDGHDGHNEEAKAGANAEKHDDHGTEGTAIKLAEAEVQAAGIKLEEVEAREIADAVTVTATIVPHQERMAAVAARVPARVVSVTARLGDQVARGAPLAQLDSLELGEARAAYEQAVSLAALADADFVRTQKLRAENIVPEKEFLRMKTESQRAQATLRAAKARLQLLGSGASGAGSMLAVASPLAGTVIERNARIGELAQPDKPLFVVADLSTLWIDARVFEKDLARLRVGAEATVEVAAYPGRRFPGKLTYVGAMLDKDTRTVPARVEVSNADGMLLAGMFASVQIATGDRVKAISVPEEAVVIIDGKPKVFVKDNAGFEPRTVELGGIRLGRTIITGGLEAGDDAVVAGAFGLKARMLKSRIGEGHAH